ncbi:MAG: B12-binding domain-containing radical SAM protein, partial [Anaerolineae bacterium]
EALLARGDRRLNISVEAAWRNGARFDAWDEWRCLEAWEHAFEETGIDVDKELYRPRTEDEPLPWDHLQSGVEKRFLLRDYRRSQAGELLSDCRENCHACGILVNYPGMWTAEWECPKQEVRSRE